MPESRLFSDESERVVLSILLQHPEKFYERIEVKPRMFSSTPHTVIMLAMLDIVEEGLVPEPTLLAEYLRIRGKLEQAGGKDYIKFLTTRKYNSENFFQFEKNVIDSYRGRSLLGIVQRVPELIRKTKDIGAVLTYLKDTISELLSASGGEKTLKIKSVMEKAWNVIVKRRENPGIQGISTGFTDIDFITNGAVGGDFIIIAGRPSQGKTAWMCSSAIASNVPCMIFSTEMNEIILGDRLISIVSQIPLTDIRQGTLTQGMLDEVYKAIEIIKQKEIYIDATFTANIEYIIGTIRKYHQLYDIKSVYVDYVQLLAERGEQATHEIGAISRRLKLLANELGIVVYLVSQLNRLVEMRENKRPILSDLRQSGNLEEDSDIVIFLYRDEYYNPSTEHKGIIENIIRKNRNGAVGTLELEFIPETVTIRSNKERYR